MTVDYQVLFPQEVVRLNTIQQVPLATRPTLDIVGQDFSSVDEVLVNDQSSPFIQILSNTRLTAQLPVNVHASEVRSVLVVSRRLTLSKSSVLRFKISDTPAKCTGLLKLMQLYVKLMLTTPGTDIFDPQLGGGVLNMLSSNISGSEGAGVVSQFIISSNNVVRQIIAIQGRQPKLPLDEKLLSANVISAKFSTAQRALFVTVELISQAGRSAISNLVM